VPDTKKIKIVAGSMNDAFGFTKQVVVTGMIEIEGNPQFRFAKDVVPIPLDNVIGPIDDEGREVTRFITEATGWQELDEELLEELDEKEEDEEEAEQEGFEEVPSEPMTEDEKFDEIEQVLAAAIREFPGLEGLEDNLAIEKVAEGLKIHMIDQSDESMFPLGSANMHQPARNLMNAVVASVSGMPNKVTITGHTDSLLFDRNDGYDNWSLSLDRADETRRTLVAAGLKPERIAGVVGKSDTDHLVPERPADPRNRRISITLLREEAPSEPAPESSTEMPPEDKALPFLP
jgi:flagellar motor protein MotB